MAERLRYAINNCRSIDMDNYMLSRNVDNTEGSDTDYWPEPPRTKTRRSPTRLFLNARHKNPVFIFTSFISRQS